MHVSVTKIVGFTIYFESYNTICLLEKQRNATRPGKVLGKRHVCASGRCLLTQ